MDAKIYVGDTIPAIVTSSHLNSPQLAGPLDVGANALSAISTGAEELHQLVFQTQSEASSDRWYVFSKRVVDVLGALLVLIVVSPVILVAALIIKLTSPGPVLFRQTRCGKNGHHFTCYKLRSMVNNAHVLVETDPTLRAEYARSWKIQNDLRITPVGYWLRKLSIDELPQLLNVVRGEMSLVGPRPVRPRELIECYGPHADRVMSAKPGLTGLWQVSGRSSIDYEQRIQLDLVYIERRSLLYDLVIIARTIPAILLVRGAV